MKDLESLLSDLDVAERAGVFSPTPTANLSHGGAKRPARFYIVSPKWAVAAVLLLSAGVWSMMFRSKIAEVREQARSVRMAVAVNLQAQLALCSSGPNSSLRGACDRVDFDGDGDVDLGDFSKYQREVAPTLR